MVQIDVPAAFIASQFFLDVGRKVIQKEAASAPSGNEPAADGHKPSVYYRFLSRSIFFAAFVIAPAGIYLLSGWPGWEQMYWTSRVENVTWSWVNSLCPTLFVMAIVLGAYLGHVVGYRWLTTGKERLLRPVYLGVLAAVVILVLSNHPAFLLVGTYDEFHGPGRAAMKYVWENPRDFGVGWLVIMGYFAVGACWMLRILLKERKLAMLAR